MTRSAPLLSERLSSIVGAALDRATEEELVLVRGEVVSLMTFDAARADARIAGLLARWSIVPVPFPRRWLVVDRGGDDVVAWDVSSQDRRASA